MSPNFAREDGARLEATASARMPRGKSPDELTPAIAEMLVRIGTLKVMQ